MFSKSFLWCIMHIAGRYSKMRASDCNLCEVGRFGAAKAQDSCSFWWVKFTFECGVDTIPFIFNFFSSLIYCKSAAGKYQPSEGQASCNEWYALRDVDKIDLLRVLHESQCNSSIRVSVATVRQESIKRTSGRRNASNGKFNMMSFNHLVVAHWSQYNSRVCMSLAMLQYCRKICW